MIITAKDNGLIKEIVKLVKSAKYRREKNMFTAEGVRICRDGVMSGYKPELFVTTQEASRKYEEDHKLIAEKALKTVYVSEPVFEKISDTKTPQGFLCVFNMLDKCKKTFTINRKEYYIALEGIQDPTNMGTILRTAEALGFSGVIMSESCCDIYSPKVVRGSMGAVFRLPFSIAEEFADYIHELSESGIYTYGSTPYSDADITQIDFDGGVMLIGNEGNGLTDETLKACSQTITIPMNGRAESLNAASAASILMWEIVRNKRKQQI